VQEQVIKQMERPAAAKGISPSGVMLVHSLRYSFSTVFRLEFIRQKGFIHTKGVLIMLKAWNRALGTGGG
jgi:hypothetical protein